MQAISLTNRISRKVKRTIRDLLRQRLRTSVAFAAPSPPANKNLPFSVHMLVCHQDLPLGICSAKSLNLAVEEPLPWVFHDDGSLNSKDKAILQNQFRGCRLVERRESDRYYQAVAGQYPHLVRSREKHVMLLKLADLHVYSDKQRILYVDSDILFLKRPEFLLEKLQENGGANYFNRDVGSVYIASLETLQNMTGVMPLPRLNAGLSVLNRDDISLDKINQVLSKLDFKLRSDWIGYDHMIEQTCVAVLAVASSGGACHLPVEYDVSHEKQIINSICKHYVGVIRHEYELEGLNYSIHEGAFFERWRRFTNHH